MILFHCPCGEWIVFVKSPPHGIVFDDDGILSLEGSVGFKGDESRALPQNWCHFDITDGKAEMYSDAQCPGSLT